MKKKTQTNIEYTKKIEPSIIEARKRRGENVNVNNFIDALSEIKGEQVKVADDEIASLLRPIKRFYNYTDRVPYEIVKDDVEEAEDMIGDLTDSPID